MKRHNVVRRRLGRLAFHVLHLPLMLLSYVHHRPYMVLYAPVLRWFGVRLTGTPRYIAPSAHFDDFSLIELGDRVVVSSEVHFLTHDYSVTTVLRAAGQPPQTDVALERGIVVGSNVFVGFRALVMPGTRIGDNVVVGAGSVVRGTIPSGSVVLGNPAVVQCGIEHLTERVEARLSSGLGRAD